jgi:hypothetical protein
MFSQCRVLEYILVWVDDVHEEGSGKFYYQELQHIFFATVGKVFGLSPMCKLIGFLTVIEREEVMDLLFVFYHDHINFLVLHFVLLLEKIVLCPGHRRDKRK